jgi:hypothetical protein
VLDGQVLTAVDIDPDDGHSAFTFDLGCTLLTRPAPPGAYDDPAEQWKLYAGSGCDLSALIIPSAGHPDAWGAGWGGTDAELAAVVRKACEEQLAVGAIAP